jgi:hypothetical protein
MRKTLTVTAAVIAFSCPLLSQEAPASVPKTRMADSLSLEDRGTIIGSIIVARYAAIGGVGIRIDGCAVRHLLADTVGYLDLIPAEGRKWIQPGATTNCAPQPNFDDRAQRLVIQAIKSDFAGATLEAAFVTAGAAHTETYRLRKFRSYRGHTWSVLEIRFAGFVVT